MTCDHMQHDFVTLFDHRYLSRGLALYESLQRHSPGSRLHVLALSDTCAEMLRARSDPHLRIIPLGEIERALPELLIAKGNRLPKEYYYTLSSAACYYMLHDQQREVITYVDADTYFFASPDVVFSELQGSSVGITPHNFHRWQRSREQYGKYNVGWVTFVRDDAGMECLTWWYRACVEWCYERIEANRYADQKYLDCWPSKFRRVHVIKNRGVNCAPWNLANARVTTRGNEVFISGDRLVFFHFADLMQIGESTFNTQLGACWVYCGGAIRRKIYLPYLHHLMSIDGGRVNAGIGPRVLGGAAWQVSAKTFLRAALGTILRQKITLGRQRSDVSFIVANNGLHSGQVVATHLIYNYISPTRWRRRLVYLPALDRSGGALTALISYVVDFVVSIVACAGMCTGRRLLLHVNLGQTRAAMLRDSAPLFLLRALRREVRAVVSLHGNNFMNWNPDDLETHWLRRIVEECSIITVLSDRQSGHLVKLHVPETKIRVLPNCCEQDALPEETLEQKHREDDVIRVLFLSSLIASKGYPEFVHAIEQLSTTTGPRIEARICGKLRRSQFDDVNSRQMDDAWLLEKIDKVNQSPRVRLAWIKGSDGAEKWALYRDAHIFVFPTQYYVEAQPIVLLEAMAFGCAIVTSRIGEIPSVLSESEAVLLDAPSATTVRDAISHLAGNRDLRLAISRAARNRFIENYTRQKYVGSWEAIFETMNGGDAHGAAQVRSGMEDHVVGRG